MGGFPGQGFLVETCVKTLASTVLKVPGCPSLCKVSREKYEEQLLSLSEANFGDTL